MNKFELDEIRKCKDRVTFYTEEIEKFKKCIINLESNIDKILTAGISQDEYLVSRKYLYDIYWSKLPKSMGMIKGGKARMHNKMATEYN